MIFTEEVAKAKEYWSQKLAEGSEAAHIPADRLTSEQTAERHRLQIRLSEAAYQKADKITKGADPLLHVLLLTAVKVCLYKYTGNSQTSITIPSGDKWLPILDTFVPEQNGKQSLLQVKQTVTEAETHAAYAFAATDLAEIGVSLVPFHSTDIPTAASLWLAFTKDASGLYADVHYNPLSYQQDTVLSFVQRCLDLLDSMLNRMDAPLAELSILLPGEQERLLHEWNLTDVTYPQTATIHQLFEEQAAKTPDRIAVVFEEQTLTYRELNEKANRLAHTLRTHGVTGDEIVAIAVDRSPEMIIGLLAILKAGGAYLP
ncbi:MAG: AMP-binding protein, partial [Tumebacillaceae bacterium]